MRILIDGTNNIDLFILENCILNLKYVHLSLKKHKKEVIEILIFKRTYVLFQSLYCIKTKVCIIRNDKFKTSNYDLFANVILNKSPPTHMEKYI